MNLEETFALAIENQKKDNLDVAQELYNQILKIDPNHVGSLINLGSVLKVLGEVQKAKICYEKAIEISPNDENAHYNFGIILRSLGRNQEAIRSFNKVIVINPNLPDPHNSLGSIFKNLKEYEKAKICYEKAIKMDPNYENAHNNLGVILEILGEHENAKTCYEKTIELNPNHMDALFNLGVVFYLLGDYRKSIIFYEKVIKAIPNHVTALNSLGKLFNKLEKYQESLDYHLKALEIDPNFVDAHYCLGTTLGLLKSNNQKAISSYEKVIELDPNHAGAHYNLGVIFQGIGNYPEAIKYYEKAIELNPKHSNAHNNLGTLFKETGENKKASVYYQEALALERSNVLTLFNLGELSYSNGKNIEAIKYLRKINTKKSRDLILKCLYKLADKSLFLKELDKHIKEGEVNASLGSIISRSEIKFETKRSNPFCGEPLEYALKTDLTKEYDFKNIFVKPIKDILKKSDISSRRQDLLTNGEQTAGNLFNKENDSLEKIKDIILLEVEKYRAHFKDSNEGFLKNWPTNIELKGWIINMKSGGKLSPHIHDYSWLSGSIYINVPPKLKTNSGNLVLSVINEPGFEKETKQNPRKIMDVVTGSLCFFPASLLHHTIPFESNEERIVFAFDVSPK